VRVAHGGKCVRRDCSNDATWVEPASEAARLKGLSMKIRSMPAVRNAFLALSAPREEALSEFERGRVSALRWVLGGDNEDMPTLTP